MKRFAILLLLPVINLYGQTQKTISTVSFQLSFPQGEYKSTYPVTGAGIRWNIMYKPSADIPISIGGEIGFLITSSDSKYFDLYTFGFFDRYRVTASNNIFSLAFKARADLVPHDKPIQLFIDGTIGTNLFFSSVDAQRETFFGNSQYAGGNSTKGYWAFIWGPGLGIEIPLGKAKEVCLSLKTSYLPGTNTKYLTDPYIDDNGNVFFTERESKTDMLVAEAGVRFGVFGKKRTRR